MSNPKFSRFTGTPLLLQDAGVENRGRFIIDPDGVIHGYEVLTPPVGRNVNETIRQVQTLL